MVFLQLILFGCGPAAVAQEESLEQQYRFDIPRQAVETALTEFAEQADLTLVFSNDLVRDKIANALRGSYSLQGGIDALLAGTGLAAKFSSAVALSISKTDEAENKEKIMKQKVGFFAAVAAAIFGGPAAAQDAASNDTGSMRSVLEEIIVTASKREETLMEVAQSVQVITGTSLEHQNLTTLQEVAQLIPGLSLPPGEGVGTPNYNLRATGAQGTSGDSPMGFYIDDVPYFIAGVPYGPDIDLFDLESLQVLRGPQGTLYGQGALGGTFVVTTQKPDLDNVTGRVRLSASDMHEGEESYKADVTGSVPLIKDQLGLRVTASWNDITGLAESSDFPGSENIDDSEIVNIRAKLLWLPTDDTSVTATLWRADIETNASNVTYTTVDPPTIENTGGVLGGHDLVTELASVVVDWETGIGTLTSATSYMTFDQELALGFPLDLGPGVGVTTLLIDGGIDASTFSQELRLVSSNEGPLQWLVGGSYVDGDRESPAAIGIPALMIQESTVTSLSTEQYSIFGEISRDFMDGRLTPLFGLRYYRDDRSQSDLGEGGLLTAPIDSTIDETYSSVSPRFNLSYRPDDQTMLFLNIAKGFRSGDFSSEISVGLADLFGFDAEIVQPEMEVWSYEIGGRFTLFNQSLLIEPSVYFNDFESYQLEALVGGSPIIFAVDDVEAIGVDVVATWLTPVEGLSINFMGHRNDSTPTDLPAAFGEQTPGIEEDEQLPFVPEWEWRVGASYEAPLGSSGYTGFANAAFYSRARQKDATVLAFSPQIEDLSVQAGLRSDRWSLTLWGKNLTDEVGPGSTRGGLLARHDRRTLGVTLEMTL